MRLYPISFRSLNQEQKFGRWNRVRFRWRLPTDDRRPESRRVEHQTIEITGSLKKQDREKLLSRLETATIEDVAEKGGSLALLRPQKPRFLIKKKPEEEIETERRAFQAYTNQPDLLGIRPSIPIKPCPYKFIYKYEAAGKARTGTCQDWETDVTFFKWRSLYGEEKALIEMKKVFGEEYPSEGMVFALGTHSRHPDTWLINGVIRLNEIRQLSLTL